MPFNESSRRGFFGKTLACLGAACAWSKAVAASAAGTAQASADKSRPAFCLYDEQGRLELEGAITSVCYSEVEASDYNSDCNSVPMSDCYCCEFDLAGSITTVECRDSP